MNSSYQDLYLAEREQWDEDRNPSILAQFAMLSRWISRQCTETLDKKNKACIRLGFWEACARQNQTGIKRCKKIHGAQLWDPLDYSGTSSLSKTNDGNLMCMKNAWESKKIRQMVWLDEAELYGIIACDRLQESLHLCACHFSTAGTKFSLWLRANIEVF